MKSFNYLSFVSKITNIGERQLKKEKIAAELIKSFLSENETSYSIHKFSTQIPRYTHSSLIVDGEKITHKASGLVSGEINGKYSIISSLISSKLTKYKSNINFNPESDFISRSNHYFAPALSITKNNLTRILNAKKVRGKLSVVKTEHTSENILVGNFKEPKSISFAHYDSIETGAIDNASGVSLMMGTILQNPELLKDNLFVFSGNEELSYDENCYWGYGFRQFEKKFQKQMQGAKKIFVLDCLGYSPTQMLSDKNMVTLGFPIKNIDKWLSKIKFFCGDFDTLMKVYHCKEDDGRFLKNKFFVSAYKRYLKEITL